MRNIKKKDCPACCKPSPTELYKFLPDYVDMICEHESKLDDLDLTEVSYLDGVTSNVQNQLDSKQQIVNSITELQNFTKNNFVYFDESVWEKKLGNVQSNGDIAAGTIIRINNENYWER